VNALRDPNVAHVLLVSFTLLLFIGSLVCLAVGAGLVFRTEATLRVLTSLNRWVSTRRVLKSLEVPRASDLHTRDARRRWVTGLVFIVGGGYAAYRLGTAVDSARVVSAFGVRQGLTITGFILVETMRWSLMVLCAAACVLGVLLVSSPRAWARIELQANRWVSTRQLVSGGDEMHVRLDDLVALHPRPAGIIVAGLSLVPLASAAILLFGR
jgi:hypothetical protein